LRHEQALHRIAAARPETKVVGQTLAHYAILAKIGSGGMGEVYLQLTHDPGSHMSPARSSDGRSIAFYGGREDGVNAFVVSATGGDARQVTTGNVSKYFPEWSPDGRWIYFASSDVDNRRIFRMPEAGGTPEQVTTRGAVYYYRWSPDGTRMYFPGNPGNDRGNSDLWEMTLADGRERRLTRFTERAGRLGATALAASRTHLYFTWRQDVGDIWTMDVIPEGRR
jgi:Tol biopolymer transport system component